MATENDERNDISLCFQALGVDFGASPDEVEKAYQRMLAEIKKKSASPDPGVRAEAATDLDLAHDLYEKIKNSVTYNSRLKDATHADEIKKQAKKESGAVQQFKICPSCNKTIGAAFKKCPFCREPIRTPFEQLMHNLFTGPSLVIIIVLLLAGIGAAIFLSLKSPKSKPPVDTGSSSVLGNQSGAAQTPVFSNQSGVVQKP